MNLKTTTLTLLSSILIILGVLFIYFSSRTTENLVSGVGIALLEMGMIGILFEHLIIPIEKEKHEEKDTIEKLEGRSCKTETLSLSIDLDQDRNLLEVREREDVKFLREKHFTPLIYMDALNINGHYVSGRPRVEAHLETYNRFNLIDRETIEKYCTIKENTYQCKNPTSVYIPKGQRTKLVTTRRYNINELTKDPNNITYNRQLWRPTDTIEIEIPSKLLETHHISINVLDYNGDLRQIVMHQTKGLTKNTVKYKIKPRDEERFFIMDKMVINMRRKT